MVDRTRSETVPTLVPEYEIDRRIEQAKAALRQEFVANIDRQALERSISHAERVATDLERARATSHRRWMTILICLFILAGAAVAQRIYASENRARLEHIERLVEARE